MSYVQSPALALLEKNAESHLREAEKKAHYASKYEVDARTFRAQEASLRAAAASYQAAADAERKRLRELAIYGREVSRNG